MMSFLLVQFGAGFALQATEIYRGILMWGLLVPGGRGTPWNFGWECAARFTLFKTKICDFHNPIFDLI